MNWRILRICRNICFEFKRFFLFDFWSTCSHINCSEAVSLYVGCTSCCWRNHFLGFISVMLLDVRNETVHFCKRCRMKLCTFAEYASETVSIYQLLETQFCYLPNTQIALNWISRQIWRQNLQYFRWFIKRSDGFICVRYHCGGRPMEVNACVLTSYSYMVYL